MRAIINTTYGAPEVVKLMEVEKPIPKDNEVLIKVYATTVNRTDCGFRSAEYFISRFYSGLFKPKNKTLGNEFAGEIEMIGKSVTSFKTGDKVFGYNDINFGAHAEYMTMAENGAITTMPARLTYEEAAPITEGGHYALCDIRAAKLKSGQKILINGATGAIGSAAGRSPRDGRKSPTGCGRKPGRHRTVERPDSGQDQISGSCALIPAATGSNR